MYRKTAYILIFSSAMAAGSCRNSALSAKKIKPDPLLRDTVTIATAEQTGNKIDYNNTKVLDHVYVTLQDGVESKLHPDHFSAPVVRFEYGAKLDVIEISGEWLGVRERVMRKFVRNGSNIESTGWEKVYIPKSATGKLIDIKLLKTDLNIITSLTIDQKTIQYEEGKILTDYLEIELTDKATFDHNKASAVNYMLADTTVIYKKNGVIILPTAKGIRKYIDKPDAEEDRQEYVYLGQIEFLNSYILQGSYWESWDYKFINKTSGKEENSFVDYPFISPDKKHILCISANPYNTTADLELYTIQNNKVRMIMAASFRNWMPVNGMDSMFWSSDGFLYVAALHINAYWDANGYLNKERQYLRIKPSL
ncbi:SH3 domain-containing protein [Flavihumibacter sp. R14]|nr:SH3 domain-containing protein [Flavihumibacter soli]